MHQDQKVGLALGVLLIGAVAAFFFRNDSQLDSNYPALQNSQEVNEEIAEKRLTPYLPPTEAGDATSHAKTKLVAATDRRTGEKTLAPPENSPSTETLGEDPFQPDDQTTRGAPAPDPIRSASAVTDTKPSSGEPQSDKPAGESELGEAKKVPEPEEALPDVQTGVPQQTVHEVQRGETLSSIAGKYLGSQARFQEVFDANRDQLRNPNDLQVGMKLKIPTGNAAPVRGATLIPTSQTKADAAAVEISVEKSVSPPATEITAAGDDGTQPGDKQAATLPKAKFTPARRRSVPNAGNP